VDNRALEKKMSNCMTSGWSPDSHEEEFQADAAPVSGPEHDPFAPSVGRKRFRLKGESAKTDSIRDITGDFSFNDGDIEDENKNRHSEADLTSLHNNLKRSYRDTGDTIGPGRTDPLAWPRFIVLWLPSLIIGLLIAWFFKGIWFMVAIGLLIAISPLWMANRYYRQSCNYGDPYWDDEANAYMWTRILSRMLRRILWRL